MKFIQHSDMNATQKHFRSLARDELLITKIFSTIQGEGPYSGVPAVFIRLAGCNRGDKFGPAGCAWCDTSFSYLKGVPMSFAAISASIKALPIRGNLFERLVVITGGEPMIQDNIVPFIEFLNYEGWHSIQIESNGDRLASGFLNSKWCETTDLVVSPKAVKNEYHPLKNVVLRRANVLKFVIEDKEGSVYFDVPTYAFFDPDMVYVSPITIYKREVKDGEVACAWDHTLIDIEPTRRNYARAAKLAVERGFHLSMQTHLFFGVE